MRYETALESVDPGWLPDDEKITCHYCGYVMRDGERYYEVLGDDVCEECFGEIVTAKEA